MRDPNRPKNEAEKQTVTTADVGTVTVDLTVSHKEEVPVRAGKTPRLAEIKAELESERARYGAELAEIRGVLDTSAPGPELDRARKRYKELAELMMPIHNELAALARVSGSNRGGIKAEAGEYKRQ